MDHSGDDALREDLLAFGCGEAEIASALGDSGDTAQGGEEDREAYAVHPSNSDALRVFLALRNKWGADAMSGRVVSPCYSDVEVVLRRLKVRDGDQVFEDFMLMEDAALRVFGDK